MQPSRPAYDRSMAIGCFGEVALEFGSHLHPHSHTRTLRLYALSITGVALGAAMAPYMPKLFPLCMAGMTDPEVLSRAHCRVAVSCSVVWCGVVSHFFVKKV